jgi:hypothetical protein
MQSSSDRFAKSGEITAPCQRRLSTEQYLDRGKVNQIWCTLQDDGHLRREQVCLLFCLLIFSFELNPNSSQLLGGQSALVSRVVLLQGVGS